MTPKPSDNPMYGVILAGGRGTRFWPKSREQFPKQFIRLEGRGTLLQNTVERLLPLIPIENILVVTNPQYAPETCRQLAGYGFSPANLVAEPVGRNTAPAAGLAAKILQEKNPDAIMGVFPADHVISNPEDFLQALELAKTVAETGYLVTLGIKPDRPETGFGYIKMGNALEGFKGVYRADCFIEKPDSETAKSFLNAGEYFWNCGVFVWKAKTLLEEMKNCAPDLFRGLEDMAGHIIQNKSSIPYLTLDPEGEKIFEQLPSISVDYAVMEKSQRVALIPTELQWSDVGSWDALKDVGPRDKQGNVVSPNVLSIDCKDSILQGEDRVIAAVGLKNLIVVDTPDALLVCSRDRAQDVKKVVAQLKKANRAEADTAVTVRKPWGSYTNLERRYNYLVKRIEVDPGAKLSLESHNHRSEHWTVVAGTAEVSLDGKLFKLKKDESVYIPKTSKHRLGNPGSEPLILIEVQIGEQVVEEDIVRYQDDYGRK